MNTGWFSFISLLAAFVLIDEMNHADDDGKWWLIYAAVGISGLFALIWTVAVISE